MQKSKVQHQNQKSGEIPGFSAFCTKKMKMSEKKHPQSIDFTGFSLVKGFNGGGFNGPLFSIKTGFFTFLKKFFFKLHLRFGDYCGDIKGSSSELEQRMKGSKEHERKYI